MIESIILFLIIFIIIYQSVGFVKTLQEIDKLSKDISEIKKLNKKEN